MTLESPSSNECLNFIIYGTISVTSCGSSHHSLQKSLLLETSLKPQNQGSTALSSCSLVTQLRSLRDSAGADCKQNLAVQGRKKRRRKARVWKNKEEAETQRMTHIAVERNRRKQMNEHLAVLRSLMPESYVQRGDQASIIGGAIEFVKELEHVLQSLEAQKYQLLHGSILPNEDTIRTASTISPFLFAQISVHPQYTWSRMPNNYTSKTNAAIADIEVNLIATLANIRILARRSSSQLSKLVTGFHTLHLTILHISVTTIDPMVLYSISAKVEEECQLTSVDDIAGATHQMLRLIEEEATLC